MADEEKKREKERRRNSRREFLKKSAYAAYATPLIATMLIEKANAAKSWNSGNGEITETGTRPPNAPVGPDPNSGRNDRPTP